MGTGSDREQGESGRHQGVPPEHVSAADVDQLLAKIGQLIVERDFLPPFVHASMHCRSLDALRKLLGMPLVILAMPMH